MREQRLDDGVIYIKLPEKAGNKTTKISLFLAKQFEARWSLNLKDKFNPPVPLRMSARKEYWSKQHYRIMIGDKWHMPKGQYTFYSLDEVMGIVKDVFG